MTGRPTLVFVTGTGTAVGKTWWTVALARELRTGGVAVAARKPVQSGTDEPTDADLLAESTGVDSDEVCPAHRRYELGWAPPMAAAELGRPPFGVHELATELAWPAATAIGLVEGVGGPRSPIASDGDNVDLVRAIEPDLVVLVADAGLGTINAVRLALTPLEGIPAVVALNRFGAEPLHRRNLEFLVDRCCLDVVTSPPQLAARVRGLARGAS